MAIVQRMKLQQFYGIGDSPVVYSYINEGFLKLSEANSPVVNKVAYVGDSNDSVNVSGYANTFAYEADYIEGNAIIDDLVAIAREQKTGDDCLRWLIDVDLSKPISGESGSYYARRMKICVEATPPTGDPKTTAKLTGNFHQVGDVEIGKCAIATRTFTADTDPTTYAVTMTLVPADGEVIIRDEDGNTIGGVSVTPLTGVVIIPNLPNGTYEYTAFADGYVTEVDVFTVASATKAIGTITLVDPA